MAVLAIIGCGLVGFTVATAFVSTSATPYPDPAAYEPDASGATISAVTADPSARTPWAIRIYRSRTGLMCSQAGRANGRIEGGEFGQVDASDGKFHPSDARDAAFGRIAAATGGFEQIPAGPSGTCANLDDAPSSIAVNSYPADGRQGARAVVFGVHTSEVVDVRLAVAGADVPLAFSADGYIGALSAEHLPDAVLTFLLRDGSERRVSLKAPPQPQRTSAAEESP